MQASLITDAQVAHQIQRWAGLVSEIKLGGFFPMFLVQKLLQMHKRKWIGRMCLHEEEIYLSGSDYV